MSQQLHNAQFRNEQCCNTDSQGIVATNSLSTIPNWNACTTKNTAMISHVETFHGTQQQPQHIIHHSSYQSIPSWNHMHLYTNMHARIHTIPLQHNFFCISTPPEHGLHILYSTATIITPPTTQRIIFYYSTAVISK